MYSIARSFLCCALLGAALCSYAGAQTSSQPLARHARLDIARTLHDGASPVGFRFVWGNAWLQGSNGRRTAVALSDHLVERDDADFAMYSEPFTVPADGGTLRLSSDAAIVGRAASGAVRGEMVLQQMIELVDATTDATLRGVHHGFLRTTPRADTLDASRSQVINLDLAGFAGRRVRLRALLVTYVGGIECRTCETPYRFAYRLYRDEAPTAPSGTVDPSLQ